MEYPKHLLEKIREEVAVSYLRHELRKIFPSIKGGEVNNLMSCKELSNPRDFWNGIHGVGMGFKLHIGFIYLLTAENIKWTKEKLDLNQLFFGVDREITKLARTREVKKILEHKIGGIKMDWVDDKTREFDPIIACQKKEGLVVYEGNGRLNKFILEKRNTIDAFVGRYTTYNKKPINFWLPTSVIMDLLFFMYQAIDEKNEELFNAQITTLQNMLSYSESGKLEFKERALTSKVEYREKILKAMGTI